MTSFDRIDLLQLRYTELCIEKRQMLNQLADLQRDSQSLRSEIHRLLDTVMEVESVSEILKDDDWSDGYDEWEIGERTFSEFGFLGDSEEENLMSHDMGLEHVVKSTLTSGRRAKSPKRLSEHPEYPLVVGRAINRIIIHSLGRLLEQPKPTPEFKWHPRGYEGRRKYIDCLNPAKRATYICRISNEGIFSVSIESNVLVSGLDPDQVWHSFLNRCSSQLSALVKSEFETLEAFFGLEHDATKRYLRRQFGANSHIII